MCAIYTKQVSVGSFLEKGNDIKDGDIVEIASEGKAVEGKFGMQNLFLVKTSVGKEGNVAFNQTTINACIDAFGADSKNWIGKSVKTWAILSNVQGKMIKVYYFTHPGAILDEEGGFTLPQGQSYSQPMSATNDEIKTEDIPF